MPLAKNITMRLDFALLTREAYKVQKKDHTAARGKVEVGNWDDIFNVAGWRPQENTRWTIDGGKDTTKDTKMVEVAVYETVCEELPAIEPPATELVAV